MLGRAGGVPTAAGSPMTVIGGRRKGEGAGHPRTPKIRPEPPALLAKAVVAAASGVEVMGGVGESLEERLVSMSSALLLLQLTCSSLSLSSSGQASSRLLPRLLLLLLPQLAAVSSGALPVTTTVW
jgi:hypothetical protein